MECENVGAAGEEALRARRPINGDQIEVVDETGAAVLTVPVRSVID
jgi:hypothetical protein